MAQIKALPEEQQERMFDAIDRLAATFATMAGVELPHDMGQRQDERKHDNVIPFPPGAR